MPAIPRISTKSIFFTHYLFCRFDPELRWSAAGRRGPADDYARHHGRERSLHAAHGTAHQPADQARQTLQPTGTWTILLCTIFRSLYTLFVHTTGRVDIFLNLESKLKS